MQDDTNIDFSSARVMQIEHACGHWHAHLVPPVTGSGGFPLLAVDMLATHPCPACLAGAPDWAIDPTLGEQDAPFAGSC
ncbi:MAG: hypothetical protein WBI63_03535 [Coriobacteriia bacterium]